MASEEKDTSLSAVFDQALELHKEVENSSEDTQSETFQSKVKKGILMLEDATRLVSILDLFSRNENYKEIPTEHLKYFMLPVLLGDLNNRITEGGRGDVVETCQIYYIDFLQRCKDYGFTEMKIPKLKAVKVDGDDSGPGGGGVPGGRPDLAKMNAERDEKMARFRMKKELDSEITKLRQLTSGATRDEDLMRELYIKMIRKFVCTCLDELSSLQMEVDVLRHMAAMRAGKIPEDKSEKKSRPIKPIIITKDKLQKEVYGMGYPSLPVLSVDEFYEQRVREGWFPPASSGPSLQNRAVDPDMEARMAEEKEREDEEKEDKDDEEELARKRNWDEWKDDHKRGEGNRKNMG